METVQAKSWNWARDELILALDLYFRSQPLPSSADDPAVVELSQTLRSLPLFPVERRRENFRNPAGVYFKLLNFHYIGTDGAAGYSNYGAADKEVYEDFTTDRVRLHSAATSIRQQFSSPDAALPDEAVEDEEAPEGKILLRLHRARERNPSLVRKRKRLAHEKHGSLRCEVCDFDFKAEYGELGNGFIECHHTVPVSQLAPNHKTKLTDLALVCANCHRMLHRGGEVLSIDALRSILLGLRSEPI
jgi:5-methylcytosine-specific restriction enzyme A